MITRHNRTALTLLELVVVLAILAALTSIAVVLTESTVEQAKYDATIRTLDNIETAIAGHPGDVNVNGDKEVSGFLADTGVLPQSLEELTAVTCPPRLVPFATRSDPAYTDVTLTSGWRGPYLKLPASGSLTDGWGNAFSFDTSTTFYRGSSSIITIRSGGGSGDQYRPPSTGSNPFSRDFTSTNVAPTALTVSIADTVPNADGSISTVTIRMLVSDPATGVRVVSAPVTISSSTSPTHDFPRNDSSGTNYIPPGLVVVRAYAGSGSSLVKSPLKYVRIPTDRPADPVILSFDIP